MNTIKLHEIFPHCGNEFILSKENLSGQVFNKKIATQIALHLNLSFLDENHKSDSNVCLANSEEVRSEYRTTFNKIDLINFLYASLRLSVDSRNNPTVYIGNSYEVPLSKTVDAFWALVMKGQNLT